jgi:spore germination cell wall hydrolase CwlJ-like protein
VVYTEARGESDEGQHTVAYVAYMRALLDLPGYGGPTPCGVALANKQFDGIRGTAFVPKEPLAWQKALIVAHMVLTKRFVPEGELRFATYYLAPKDASKTGWCWFKRNLIPIGWVGQHLFYREPLRYERGMLATHCPEYAARMVASR